ncbi:hypothetical protein ALC56_03560 [Trachymyrmex septentrionalis]|uniref:Uncharacterized protein n=1 Tax=Trachymyrmex septentrionalis TaxID=34720 RepID=A0A195FNV7_9HYME|nr:hypothetical protein ALC56_03560 [Trachymyrmex septentrionalis]
MHHGRIRVCIYIGHMVVSTVLGPPTTGNGLNTNFQFVRAYRPDAQERDTNARCNQRIAKEGALQRNPCVNPRSSSAVTLPPE